MSKSDSPQPVASAAEIDALEYVVHEGIIGAYDRPVLLAWLARLQRTPAEPSAPSEGTRQAECTLTDAERAAIEWAAAKSDAESHIAQVAAERGYIPEIGGDPRQWARNHAARAAALRALLDRIGKTTKNGDSPI